MATPRPRRDGRAATLIRQAAAELAARGIDSARLDAEVILAHCLGLPRQDLLVAIAAGREPDVDPAAGARFEQLLRRRAAREPVAYLTGRREFWSLEFEVTPEVLIPRPETEHVVATALALLPRAPGEAVRFVDVGTGSGAIAVAILKERPDARGIGIDISEGALRVARRNAQRHAVADRLALVRGDLLAPVRSGTGGGTPVRAVVSNPPYISPQERDGLMPEVRDWEPPGALFDETGGLVPRLVREAARVLPPDGVFVMEVAEGRDEAVRGLLSADRLWDDVGAVEDYAGRVRVLHARRRTG